MATRIVARPETWTHARRKSDGLPFYIVPGSTPTVAYYVTSTACTCPSFRHRGACKHQAAVAEHERSQRPTPSPKPRVSYESLFPKCRGCHDIADGRDGYCYACASTREHEARMASTQTARAKEAWL